MVIVVKFGYPMSKIKQEAIANRLNETVSGNVDFGPGIAKFWFEVK